MGCCSHNAGGNSRGTETGKENVLGRTTQRSSHKTVFQTLVTHMSSKYPKQGRTQNWNHCLNSQDYLFHAAEENDGWHQAYAVSVLSLTLCSLLKKIGMWFTLAKTFAWNICWHWAVVCGTGKKQFSCSPESWGLETAGAQLPLSHCQKQNALWGNDNLNVTASTKTTQGDAAVASKGW